MGNVQAEQTVREIEKMLFGDETNILDHQIEQLKQDKRKGVQTLIKRYERMNVEKETLTKEFREMNKYEDALRKQGFKQIVGVDEVGRGPLAGPVVAAAVILPEGFCSLGLTDSKKLSKAKRDMYYKQIMSEAVAVGVGMVSAKEIDKLNIYQATKRAMTEAIEALSCPPEHILVDAMNLGLSTPSTSLIKGDQKSISIAASSVVAKVTRDRWMEQLATSYEAYGFENHMGYGTKEHLEALRQFGVTDEHRRSFAPVKNVLLNG